MKKNNTDYLINIRKNWKELRINTEQIIIINFETKVDKNSPPYSLTNDNETFSEWFSRNPNREELIDLPRTKILCTYKESKNVTREFSTIINKDQTVVEFKLRLQNYISVYIPDAFDGENYFIDLEFLQEEIDFTKFK